MAENVNILLAKTNAESIMNAYNQRQAKLAEIAAKKELVSMSTAIDTAAGKGNGKLVYRLSGSITRLTGSLLASAIAIIEADITAAGYEVKKDTKGTTYTFAWVEEEEEEPAQPSGNTGSQDDNPQGVTTGDDQNDQPGEPVTPTVYTSEQVEEVTETDLEGLEDPISPVTQGWLESNGEGGYVASDDTEMGQDTTYYKLKTPAE